jgi:lipoate-protein ligase A
MNGHLRVVDTGLASGRWNTALSAALLDAGAWQGVFPTLRFYRFARCVLLGAGQSAVRAADLDHCARADIEIARRITGGGSVYMSPSMLAWDIVVPQSATVDALGARIGAALAAGLQAVRIAGVTASSRDLSLNGRKISGAATTSLRGQFLYQGTLLIADEVAPMAAALGVPVAPLAAGVTSLAVEDQVVPALPVLQAAIAAHLATAFGLAVADQELPSQQMAWAEREYAREIGTDAFVFADEGALRERASA